MRHDVTWRTPSSLWPAALADQDSVRFERPELLRFETDTFMEDLQQTLETNAGKLKNFVARTETAEQPAVGWLPDRSDGGSDVFNLNDVLKLYQPAHQRFYLVGASLVCLQRGFPDRRIDPANQEGVSFVLRRVLRRTGRGNTGQGEYGWFSESGWKLLTDAEHIDRDGESEERLPMFPVTFPENGNGKARENGNGKKRRLLVGLVPIGGRETYEAAPRDPRAQASGPTFDPRKSEFEANVVQPLVGLRDAIFVQLSPAETSDEATARTNQVRDVFTFALLDFAQFLQQNFKIVWQAVQDSAEQIVQERVRPTVAKHHQASSTPGKGVLDFARFTSQIDTAQRKIFDAHLDANLSPHVSWSDALVAVWNHQQEIVAGSPQAVQLLNNLTRQNTKDAIDILFGIAPATAVGVASNTPNSFYKRIRDYLDDHQPSSPPSDAPTQPDAAGGSTYIIRCVYERPHCEPFHGPVVSPPSQPFQLASFFDPDAPRRPSRIAMPDTSLASLRKSQKSVQVAMSKKLAEQLNRVQGVKLGDLDDGDIPAGEAFNLGMICTLSIPIITICALILLMIIVQLLNIVFWWLPFFKVCLPLDLKED